MGPWRDSEDENVRLIYTAITSLDGFVEDSTGNFDWSMPDEEVHSFINDLERPVSTYLLGRRMYEVMVVWETMPTDGEPPAIGDYARIWSAAEKVVYSRTLQDVSSERTRIERNFDPTAVKAILAAATGEVSIGGAALAGQAMMAGLVDEVRLFISSVVVGGGKLALPGGLSAQLALTDERRFSNGVVYLRYDVLR